MKIETYVSPLFGCNAYFFEFGGKLILIDAPLNIVAHLKSQNCKPNILLLTHQHVDHVIEAAAIAEMGAEVYAFGSQNTDWTLEFLARESELKLAPFPVTTSLAGKTHFSPVNGLELTLFHIPGHSPDSLVFYREESKTLFSGDTLFQQSIGRTDFPNGNHEQLLQGIRNQLFSLPNDVSVFPGHGEPTEIGIEKATNPFLAF